MPATTALASFDDEGRRGGFVVGANVVMQNLSPAKVREKYNFYDNKKSFGDEAVQGLED